VEGRWFAWVPAASLACAAVLAASPGAHAHKMPPERRVVVQVDDAGVAALIELRVRGREAALLAAVHDRNRDGRLDANERKGLAAVLAAKAASGLTLRYDGALVALSPDEAHLVDDGTTDGALAVALLVQAGLPRADAGAVHRLALELDGKHGGAEVQAQGLGGWQLADPSRGALAADRAGLREPVELTGGEGLAFQIVRVGAEPPPGR
jgi:hypothetical protein